MTDIAIRVENLGKRYKIGALQKRHDTLRDALMDIVPRIPRIGTNSKERSSDIRAIRGEKNIAGNANNSRQEDTIWALKDVSFEVKRGEVVGIIGRNGAGKSTMLKILSRITKPTEGWADIHGRVGSLLEVGTGFHPELTGRENIYLNGAILGMHRVDIERKFDEIVAFAEVEKFIDTPVKHYSSGMYVRLAFAVAAHLEPDILLVDEVLAVGDAAFQKKCLGKMSDVAREGRTVLFVSHNMQSVARLCERALLLDKGRIERIGDTSEIVAAYLNSGHGLFAEKQWDQGDSAPGDDLVRLNLVRARTQAGVAQQVFDSREPIGIEIGYTVSRPVKELVAEFVIYDEGGNLIFPSANQYDEDLFELHSPGRYLATGWIPGNLMTEGTFFVRIDVVEVQVPVKIHVFEQDILVIQIVDRMEGDSARGRFTHAYPGFIRPRLDWTTRFLGEGSSLQWDSRLTQSLPNLSRG